MLEIDKENRRLSLGHKQLEENPWNVFETIFTVDSIHEGTVVEIFDKGAIVALPYGVEGFVTPKNLIKEDGQSAKVDEKLPFKVIEFNKSAKRIILSHSKVYEAPKAGAEAAAKNAAADEKKALKKINKSSVEKTTFGDISELAALKEEMEADERKKFQERFAQKEAEKAAAEKAAEVTEEAEKVVKKTRKAAAKAAEAVAETAAAAEEAAGEAAPAEEANA